jgi:glycosyltransferase involved in cell wall biosynthesis
MPAPPDVVVLTIIPSPYQVELFNAVAAGGRVGLRAVYVQRQAADRQWAVPDIKHAHTFLDVPADEVGRAERWTAEAELAVFSTYSDPRVRGWMRRRAADGRAWCFWGERPGFRGLGLLGALYRRWRLAPLHLSDAPIWGMGSWAVEAWRREFGTRRPYFRVPYFSDLERFARAPTRRTDDERRVLFSGSLIPRKGVDLLARAFRHVAAQHPKVRLDLVGGGELEAPLRAQLRELGGRVVFHGFQGWERLPDFYRAADVLCVPSRYDGWGLVVPEGLAAGLPVIGTDRTGAALDLIRPGNNGWLVPAGRYEPLVAALEEATTLSVEELCRRSDAARQSVAGHTLQDGVRTWTDAALASLDVGRSAA